MPHLTHPRHIPVRLLRQYCVAWGMAWGGRGRKTDVASGLASLVVGIIFFAFLPMSQKVTFAADAADEYELSAKPTICITQKTEEPCSMMLEIHWQANGNPGPELCLHNATLGEVVQCWENARAGSLTLEHASSGNIIYQLISRASARVHAEIEIQVVSRDVRNTRHRRRHVWSIL